MIEEKFKQLCDKPSDINQHLPVLRKYAEECDHVTEMGVRWIVSTWALLAAKPKKLVSIDIKHPKAFGANIDEVYDAAKSVDVDYSFVEGSVLEMDIEKTDLLFIDTWHVAKQLESELKLHSEKAGKYIILHDTTTFGVRGEDGGEGLKKPLNEFLEEDPNWVLDQEYTNNNGLTVLRRVSTGVPKKKINREVKPFSFKFGKKEFQKSPKVKFIVAFPDVPHYLWQVLVQINNFKRFGYDVDTHYLVGCFNGEISKRALNMFSSDKILSKVHFYHDTRPDVTYYASLKPWLMAQYFRDFPKEKDNVYVLLDPDVIFLEDLDWSQFLNDDHWYESDTRSYLNTAYINSKGNGLLKEMCDTVGISEEVVVGNDDNTGGAQYVLKNNTFELWDEVWKKSIDLFYCMDRSEEKYRGQWKDHPIQKWTSEMWTTNWCAWKRGIKTIVSDDLHFNWANHFVKGPKHKIFHNAGITNNNGPHFCRTHYQSSPFNKEIQCSEESMSYFYKLEVLDTEKNFSDKIWD